MPVVGTLEKTISEAFSNLSHSTFPVVPGLAVLSLCSLAAVRPLQLLGRVLAVV